MKEKIINGLIWLAIICIVIFWTWFLEWMAPGTPFQAFFASLLMATPITIIIILATYAAVRKINNSIDLLTDSGFAEDSQLVEKQNEGERNFEMLDKELLYPYTSLSWKYKLISDFCFDYPELLPRLKENKNYIRWRTDVIDWAKDNIDRVESFNFNDGICDYIFDASVQTQGIVDLKAKYNTPQEMDYSVICDVEIKNKRVPEDYFEFPGLVWEDERMEVDDDDYDDDYGNTTKRSKASDALALGIGIGIVNGLTGDSVFGGGSNGN